MLKMARFFSCCATIKRARIDKNSILHSVRIAYYIATPRKKFINLRIWKQAGGHVMGLRIPSAIDPKAVEMPSSFRADCWMEVRLTGT